MGQIPNVYSRVIPIAGELREVLERLLGEDWVLLEEQIQITAARRRPPDVEAATAAPGEKRGAE